MVPWFVHLGSVEVLPLSSGLHSMLPWLAWVFAGFVSLVVAGVFGLPLVGLVVVPVLELVPVPPMPPVVPVWARVAVDVSRVTRARVFANLNFICDSLSLVIVGILVCD